MRWSIKLGKFAGVKLYLHWTFLILLGWVFFANLGDGNGVSAAFTHLFFIVALFGCIVLHEFGHALAARRYGIETRDITLLPIGGVARLERMPRQPRQELWVALAGPAVNAIIAGVLFVILFAAQISNLHPVLSHAEFLTQLLWVNLFLIAFNLLPAFPMDGGRVLRAILARKIDYVRATRIAARIGQIMAILFVVVGFQRQNAILMLIGVFIFIGARNEAHIVEVGRNLEPLNPERPLPRPDYTVRSQ